MARDEVGAGDPVGRVFLQVDDAVEEVHQEPVERAQRRDQPRVAAPVKSQPKVKQPSAAMATMCSRPTLTAVAMTP